MTKTQPEFQQIREDARRRFTRLFLVDLAAGDPAGSWAANDTERAIADTRETLHLVGDGDWAVANDPRAPHVGEAFTIGAETLVPTCVKIAATPDKRGGCRTDLAAVPAGWYVEFTYPGDHIQHRRFIPFGEVR